MDSHQPVKMHSFEAQPNQQKGDSTEGAPPKNQTGARATTCSLRTIFFTDVFFKVKQSIKIYQYSSICTNKNTKV